MCASRTLSRRSNTRGFDTPMRQLSPEGLAAQLPVALVNEHPKLRASKLDSEGRRLFGRLVEILAGHLQKRPAPTTLTDVSKMHKEAASRLSTYVHKATLADATYGAVDKKVRRSHWPPGTCKPASQDLLHAPPALISRATSHHLCCARMTQACHGFLCGCGSARLVGRSPGWPAPPAQHRPALPGCRMLVGSMNPRIGSGPLLSPSSALGTSWAEASRPLLACRPWAGLAGLIPLCTS